MSALEILQLVNIGIAAAALVVAAYAIRTALTLLAHLRRIRR